MSWTPANSFGTRAAHPSRIRVLSEHRESTYPSQVVTCRPHFAPISPLAATLMDLPASCCGQKTYGLAKPLNDTYKKPGEGAVGNVFPHRGAFNTASHLPYALPSSASRKSFACRSYENTRGVGVVFPLARSCSGHTNPQHQSLSPYLVTCTHPRRSRPFRRKLNHAVS